MKTVLFQLPLRNRRDLLIARQRTRQIAGMLGFDRREQFLLAAEVFRMVCESRRGLKLALLHFLLDGDNVQILVLAKSGRSTQPFTSPNSDQPMNRLYLTAPSSETVLARLERPLPDTILPRDRADLPWLLRELHRLTPFNLFDELQQENQAFLTLAEEKPAGPLSIWNWHEEQEHPPAA